MSAQRERIEDNDAGRAAGPAARPSFSVVIPTYNEASDVGETIAHVLAQTVPVVDIVVVDGGSKDGTLALLRRHARDPRVQVIEEGRRRGVSAARNAGIRACTGDIVVILNADVLLPPDFIARLIPLYQQDIDLVSVESRVQNTDVVPGRYLDAIHRLYYGETTVGWSEGFSCRREAALAATFPEEIPGAGGEDVEFVDRLLDAGYRWKVDYSIVVAHRVPDSLGGFWAQMHGRGCAVPYIEHSLKKMPLPLVTLRRVLAWGKSLATALLVVPNLVLALRTACRSPRGLADAPAFWCAQHLQVVACRTGEFRSLRELWGRRKAAA